MKVILRRTFCICFLVAHAIGRLQQGDFSTKSVTSLPRDEGASEFVSGTTATLAEERPTEVTEEDSTVRQLPNTSVKSGTRHEHSRPQRQQFSATELQIHKRALDFEMYYTLALSLCGVLTNSLSAVVFASKWKKEGQQTVSMVMVGLSITDILSVFLQTDVAIYRWTNSKSSITMTTASGCQIVVFVLNWARDCSSYFILAFTVERFVAVRFPLKRGIIVTKARMLVAMAAIVITSAVGESYILILELVEYVPTPKMCMPTSVENGKLLGLYGTIFRNGLGFLLPGTAVATLNGLIVRRVKQQRFRRASMLAPTTSKAAETSAVSKSPSLTRMLVVASTFSFACSFPKTVFFLWMTFHGVGTSLSFSLIRTAIICMSQLSYTSNFFLYCLTGSEFRKSLREKMQSLRPRVGDAHSEKQNTKRKFYQKAMI